MKRTLGSITTLMLLLAGLVLTGCSSGNPHDHGSEGHDMNNMDMPQHQHSQ